MSEEAIVLFADNVRWTCAKDEDAFFRWLKKIKCVQHYEGVGCRLEITIDEARVDERSFRDLVGLFYRYNIDLKQFAHHFRHTKFNDIVRVPNAYWHQRMYGA